MTTSHLRRFASVSMVELFVGIGVSAPLAEAVQDEELETLNLAELRARVTTRRFLEAYPPK